MSSVSSPGPRSWSQLVTALREDWEANGSDWSQPGFRALAIHRFGVWVVGLEASPAQKVTRKVLNVVYRVLFRAVRNLYGIEIPRSVVVGRRLRVAHQGSIVIHPFARIGDDCVLRHGVTLGNAGRGVNAEEAPLLEDDVQVGAGAMILGRIRIGAGARLGPNVVVYTDIPAGATVVAPPPRIIAARKDEGGPITGNQGGDQKS